MLVGTTERELKMDKLNILGIVGSLRKDSFNHFALKAAQELLRASALELNNLFSIPSSEKSLTLRHL